MLKTLSQLVTRHPRVVVVAWFLIFGLAATGAVQLSSVVEPMEFGSGSETDSAQANLLMDEEFPFRRQANHAFFVVYQSDGTDITSVPHYNQTIRQTVDGIEANFNVLVPIYSAIHYFQDPIKYASFLSDDNTTTYLMIIPIWMDEVEAADDTDTIRTIVHETVKQIPSLQEVAVTGPPASFHDQIEAAMKGTEEADVLAIIAVSFVLIFIFGSLLGITIPVIALLTCLITVFFSLWLLSGFLPVTETTPSVVSMIGIGLAADYSLLVLSRFREEKESGKSSARASELAMQTAGRSVLFSGFTVMVGFGALLIPQTPFTDVIAVAVIITVLFSLAVTLTLTPALLSLFGDHLGFPRWLSERIARLKDLGTAEGESFWARWSHFVMKHPWPFLIMSCLFFAPFLLLATQLNLGMPGVESLPEGTEAKEGYEILANHFSEGITSPVEVLIQTADPLGVYGEAIATRMIFFAEWCISRSLVDSVSSYCVDYNRLDNKTWVATSDEVSTARSNPESQVTQLARFYVSSDNDTALFTIRLAASSGASETWSFVEDAREKLDGLFPQDQHHIGGMSAEWLDSKDALVADFPLMVIATVVLIFLILMILLRSILLPLKTVLTISTSVLFSYGLLVLVFQEGIGADLIGAQKLDILFIVPLLLFTIVFGLSMDYGVFIMTRIQEEYQRTGDNAEAVALGIEKTGSVVTSAALIIAATFMAFVFSDIVFLKMFGLALALAVLIDASLIRVVLLPSAMKLFGDWNWWLPAFLESRLPQLKID